MFKGIDVDEITLNIGSKVGSNIDSMFYGSTVQLITLETFETDQTNIIGNTFCNCRNLTKIILETDC